MMATLETVELSYDESCSKSFILGEHPNRKPFAATLTTMQDDEEASVDPELDGRDIPVDDELGNTGQFFHGGLKEDSDDKRIEEDKKIAHSVAAASLDSFKYLFSVAILVFSVVLVVASIFSKQTIGTSDMGIHPVLAFFIFWLLVIWLAMMEGGQGCLVGLQPIDKQLYTISHPITLKNTSFAHHGDNMERFIVGRQFLMVMVVFVINLVSSSVADSDVLGLWDGLRDVFLTSGVALILTTIVLGQLTAQVNAANCMLDFINSHFMLYFVTYVSLAIECSGLLHSVYLVQNLFSKLAHTPIETKEPPRNALQKLFFGVRVLVSLVILGIAFAVTVSALFEDKTTVWNGVPPVVSVILFFVLLCFVGMMEGVQIALFAVVNLPQDTLKQQNSAQKSCSLAFNGDNLQAFLIGRQIAVTICTFLIARIATVDVQIGVENNIFGVSDRLQELFNTGLLGALITTIVASLVWRVVASSFPIAFLSNPFVYLIIRFCLLLEQSGVCSSAWVLARYHKVLANYQPDEIHLEGAIPSSADPATRRDKEIDRLVTIVRFTYSLALLLISLAMVTAALFTEQTTATNHYGLHPVLAFIIFWALIIWLAMLEGSQGSLISFPKIVKSSLETHAKALQSHSIIHEGDNVERFIVGRQFIVVVIIYALNWTASSVGEVSVLGIPERMNLVFLATGIALILITSMVGQLITQVNAANCKLDCSNNFFTVFLVTYLSLAIEFSGLFHSVYLARRLFSRLTKKSFESKEPPRSELQNTFFWGRVVLSVVVLGGAATVTFYAIFLGKTTMWDGATTATSVVVYIVLMCFVGILEGIQIALFSAGNLAEDELKENSVAYENYQLATRQENLQVFLIGRQLCVTICMFVFARITTVTLKIGVDNNMLGVTNSVQELINTGIGGVIITTTFASLVWRIIACSFPIAFLSNPFSKLIIRFCFAVEACGVCSAAWMLGRWHKLLVGYQPDDVYLDGAKKRGLTPVTRRDKDIDIAGVVIRLLYSSGLLIFSCVIIMMLIFSEQTKLSQDLHPLIANLIFWFSLLWVGMMEGGQVSLVGLQTFDKELYRESHRITLKSASIAHKDQNMERFVIGRQFLVVVVMFVTNLCGNALPNSNVLNLSEFWKQTFVQSGIPVILVTIMIGVLASQINAARCMLDFISTHFMVFTTYMSLAIESSGLLHCVYLVKILFCKVAGKSVKFEGIERTGIQEAFFWSRVAFSVFVLSYAFAVTVSALFDGTTTMWDGASTNVSIALFFGVMCCHGILEGTQLALFAAAELPEYELSRSSTASATYKLAFKHQNLQAFLIGRQILATICMFVLARIATLNVEIGVEKNTFGVPDSIQDIFNTGLLGALIATVVASLVWRIIASCFPVAFLANPLVYVVVRLCLLTEASGLCSASLILAAAEKRVAGLSTDDKYIGTVEERAARAKELEEKAKELDEQEIEAQTTEDSS